MHFRRRESVHLDTAALLAGRLKQLCVRGGGWIAGCGSAAVLLGIKFEKKTDFKDKKSWAAREP